MTEPYRHNPLAPQHLNDKARADAIKRGEDVTAPTPTSSTEKVDERRETEEDAVQQGPAGEDAGRDPDEVAEA